MKNGQELGEVILTFGVRINRHTGGPNLLRCYLSSKTKSQLMAQGRQGVECEVKKESCSYVQVAESPDTQNPCEGKHGEAAVRLFPIHWKLGHQGILSRMSPNKGSASCKA